MNYSTIRKLTIVVERDQGIFLGSYGDIAIFSKIDVLGSTKAYGFKDTKTAESFIEKYLPAVKNTVDYIEIPCSYSSVYVDVIDIIKAGHSALAEDLFKNLPTNSKIH